MIDKNHGGFILFDEFCLWLSKTNHPDIDQLNDRFKVEKTYKSHGQLNEYHEIPDTYKPEHVPKKFTAKINNIDEHL